MPVLDSYLAFVFEDQETRRIAVYCVVDAPMLSQLIKKRVVERLQNLYGERYRHDNVMLSATHTHALVFFYCFYRLTIFFISLDV